MDNIADYISLFLKHITGMDIDPGLMKVDYGSTSHDPTKEDSMGMDPNGELECDLLTRCSLSTIEEPPRLRRIALELSLWINVFVTITKLVAYIRTSSLSVLAALVDSVLDIVSQLVLNYT